MYILQNRYEESLPDCDACIRLDPSFNKGYYRKAVALQNLRRYKEVRNVCNEAIKHVRAAEFQELLRQLPSEDSLEFIFSDWKRAKRNDSCSSKSR